MSVFDIVICVILLISVWSGARQGVIKQVISLVGVVAAIWLSVELGQSVGQMLGLPSDMEYFGGFVAVFIAVIIVVAILGQVVSKIFKIVGAGIIDTLLGGVVAAVKAFILLAVLLYGFEWVNGEYDIINASKLSESILYDYLIEVAERVLPAWDWVKEQVTQITN